MQPIRNGTPALVLAPMEGVTDAPMRALQSERGGFTHLVSEFIRVSQDVLPKKTFLTDVPELKNQGRTSHGHSVQVQLLGGHAGRIAESAWIAVSAGAPGIDLNFGCPAPTVNRHDGGATLLLYPLRIREIVEAVRAKVPKHIPVSAKLRLGWDELSAIHANSEKAAEGGADWIAIHGRTKMQGYRPPAYWGPIGEVKKRLKIPVIANGEIWTLEDLRRCRDETQCEHFMIGRGALADPALPLAIAQELGIGQWDAELLRPFGEDRWRWLPLVERFIEVSEDLYTDIIDSNARSYLVRRVKQWVRMAHQREPLSWWEKFKTAETIEEALTILGGCVGRDTGQLRPPSNFLTTP